MHRLFHKAAVISCFFCQTDITPLVTVNPRSFLCPYCQQWNRYDDNGEIMSDNPAMHEESLNAEAFARRAIPRNDRFRSQFSNVSFCDICQNNQRLVMSLLSSYLPPSEQDPEFSRKFASFEDYRLSVEARYPQVCSNCMPLVEEEIRQKDNMARANALGRSLQKAKQNDFQRYASSSLADRKKFERELRWWRLRGVLYWVTLGLALAVDASMAGFSFLSRFSAHPAAYLIFILLSLLWMAWDPIYPRWRRASMQGRHVRLQGRNVYNRLQTTIWFCRLIRAALLTFPRIMPGVKYLHAFEMLAPEHIKMLFMFSASAEVLACVSSFFVLRLGIPSTVGLLDDPTSVKQRQSTLPQAASATGVNLRASPSLTDQVSQSRFSHRVDRHDASSSYSSAIFGRPSLLPYSWLHGPPVNKESAYSRTDSLMSVDEEGEAMDWTPTVPSETLSLRQAHIGAQLHVDTTGLESLFAQTGLSEESRSNSHSSERATSVRGNSLSLAILSLLFIVVAWSTIWLGSKSWLFGWTPRLFTRLYTKS